jgi:hypothetical protein
MRILITLIFLCIFCIGISVLISHIVKHFVEIPPPTNVELLIKACFDDKQLATNLINIELRNDSSIDTELAAVRALATLNAKESFKNRTTIDFNL